jgi:predicted lipoprotein with Yx(FWY)xxD motif
MTKNGQFARRRVAIIVASMGGLALASCASSPGGIVVESDGAGGARDSASDLRESGGGQMDGAGGAAGANSDGAVDVAREASDDRGQDSGMPPMCVFHTDPPPLFSQFDDSGVDGTSDASGSDAADASSADAGPADTGVDMGSADIATVDATGPDGAGADATTADVSTIDASNPDAVGDATTSDASGDRSGGRDGGAEAGDGGPVPSITILNSPFLGPYLADSAGRTLYTFGNDKPGDCNYPPLPDCEADCAIAWPPFDAGKRTLAPALDPAVFGSATRADGVSQVTTYYGWPLWYYRSDTTGNVINGQGKSKTWHVATVSPANMMIMRDKTNPRYIADGNGHTLYVFDQDTAGTVGSDPVSACVGDCLSQYPPLLRNRINAVSSLDPNDLLLFVRGDMGRQQVAYKGAPLYLSAADMRSGDQKGVAMGWTVAAAP